MTYVPVGERTTLFSLLAISIVKNAWRTKKAVGKKGRVSNLIRQKQKTGNLSKQTLKALFRR